MPPENLKQYGPPEENTVDLVIRLNGEPIDWRPFTEEEFAPYRRWKAQARKRHAELFEQGKMGEDGLYKGIRYNLKEQYHAFLLVECKPGDDITCDGVPEGYEEVWVRFNMEIHGRKDRGNLRIAPSSALR